MEKFARLPYAPMNEVNGQLQHTSHIVKQKCHSVATDGCCCGAPTTSLRPEMAGDPCVSCYTLLSTVGVLTLK